MHADPEAISELPGRIGRRDEAAIAVPPAAVIGTVAPLGSRTRVIEVGS